MSNQSFDTVSFLFIILMKILFLIFIHLFYSNSIAQLQILSGKVIDKNRTGVPFCIIENKVGNQGIYCDENGNFNFYLNTDSVNSLVFYAVGYEKKELFIKSITKDSITIILEDKMNQLNEIVINSRRGKIKKGVLGKKNLKLNGNSFSIYGNEIAIFLENENNKRQTFLNEIFIFITSQGLPTTKFRVHVYSKDIDTGLPAIELTDSNIIVNATKGNEWVSVNLSNKNIIINNGIFVSVEWVSGLDNNKEMQILNKNQIKYNGQVLGLTWSYGLRSIIYFKNKFNRKWEYDDPTKYDFKIDRKLNPMIYCTYNYYK